MYASSPVSYTHLGKAEAVQAAQRHVQNGKAAAHSLKKICKAAGPQRGTVPVSYTHLDVYKRQVALGVHVQERGGAAQAHGRAVLLLYRRKIPEVQPVNI